MLIMKIATATFFPALPVKCGVEAFYEDHMYIADPSVFKMFAYPLITGDPFTALADQKKVVISESRVKNNLEMKNQWGNIIIKRAIGSQGYGCS